MVIFWKCYFPTNFSHFLNYFSASKQILYQEITTTHTLAPTENPPLSTQNPPPHNTETTKTPPSTPPQQQQQNQRSKRSSRSAREWLAIKQIGDDQTRFKREREIEIEKERDWRCELRTQQCKLDGTISPLRLGLGRDLAHSPYSLFFLSLCCFARLWLLLSLSLSLFACLYFPEGI